MWIIVLVFSALAVWAVVATLVVTLRDGYRGVPAYANEGNRKRLPRDSVGA